MKRRTTYPLLILILVSALFAPDCATLIHKRTQGIPITSSPAGATVIVNGVQQGVTPLMITMDRAWKGQVIRIESSGYNPVEIRPKRKLSGGIILGNFLFGLIPGSLVAMGVGLEEGDAAGFSAWALTAAAFGGLLTLIDGAKAYSLHPKDLTVTLTKADGTPRVDTILIDVDDFRDISWIRVRKD